MAEKKYKGRGACDCPPGDLSDVTRDDNCTKPIGQIVAVALQKKSGTLLFDGSTTNITDPADWTTALGLTGADKLILTPVFGGAQIVDGVMNVNGENDNASPFGAGTKTNHNLSVLNANFLNLSLENEQALMEALNCSGPSPYKAWLINDAGQAIFAAVDGAGTEQDGIPVAFTKMDGPTTEGFNSETINAFQIKFRVPDISFRQSVDVSSFIFSI